MAEMQDEFYCSDYPEYHFLHNKKNKKVLGKFKDEMCGNIIYEYVGLRSKMYSIVWCEAPKNLCVESSDDEGFDVVLDEGSIRTCKGISKSVNKLVLKHNMYKNCLMDVELRNDRVQRWTVQMKSICINYITIQNIVLPSVVLANYGSTLNCMVEI